MIEFFSQYRPYSIRITMYGSNNETYQKVCGIPNGFDVVSRNVLEMINAKLPVSVTSTITKDNYNDIESLMDWGNKQGIHITAFLGLVNSERGENGNIEELRVRYTDKECYIDENMRFKEYHSDRKISRTKAFSICRDFGHKYDILWDGRMVCCNTFTSVYEEPLKSSIGDCYKNLIQRLDALKRPAECETCRYFDFCNACPSVFLSDTGDCEKTCEEICRKARCHYKRALLIKEEDNNEDK